MIIRHDKQATSLFKLRILVNIMETEREKKTQPRSHTQNINQTIINANVFPLVKKEFRVQLGKTVFLKCQCSECPIAFEIEA